MLTEKRLENYEISYLNIRRCDIVLISIIYSLWKYALIDPYFLIASVNSVCKHFKTTKRVRNFLSVLECV